MARLFALPLLAATIPWQATLNATLNALAGVLLVIGYVLIRRRRETAHKRTMLAAFVVSVLFLVSYVTYHFWPTWAATTEFQGPRPLQLWFYYPLLASHVILAAMVPVLAVWTIYLGLRDRRERHRRLARWTFPIWLYVSVTGVTIYLMLYYLYPQP